MSIRYLPNAITLLRVGLLFPLAYFLIEQQYTYALIVFMVAGASDGIDGLLAKHFKWTSRFGAIADPIADKLLMLVSYSLLTWQNFLPLWLLVIVVGRDLLIVTGAMTYHRLFGPFQMEPTWLSKGNTALQIFLVTLVMFSLVFKHIPTGLIDGFIVLVALSSVLSGFQYGWVWGRRRTNKPNKNHKKEATDGNN